jgi:hypothetical protein
MTQRMTPRGFENTGFGPSFLKSPLQDGFMEMMPALFTGVSVREMAHRRKDPLPAPFVPNGALLFKTFQLVQIVQTVIAVIMGSEIFLVTPKLASHYRGAATAFRPKSGRRAFCLLPFFWSRPTA